MRNMLTQNIYIYYDAPEYIYIYNIIYIMMLYIYIIYIIYIYYIIINIYIYYAHPEYFPKIAASFAWDQNFGH